MKNIIYITAGILISFFVYSCTKDNNITKTEDKTTVEIRSACMTSPAASYIYGNSGACCINVRYLSMFNNLPTTVTWCGTTYGPVTITGGVAVLCYDSLNNTCPSSDIEIKVYDNMGNEIACNTFTSPC